MEGAFTMQGGLGMPEPFQPSQNKTPQIKKQTQALVAFFRLYLQLGMLHDHFQREESH